MSEVPDFYETARTGIHYLLPVSVLIWCLMVEEMSPGLAAFWGVVAMSAVVLTQKPLTAFFRRQGDIAARLREGWWDFIGGLEFGARNMAAVGIATATAGIMVGTVTLTGIGLVMAEIVEFLSQGNIVIMLVLVGVICIVLGTGLPTTASYVVVATLMAPVVVELAAENDLAVPLIAVHMFVFYFGLMADVSPPVGLAAYAAAAIAGADPMRVGWQGTWYEFRTVLLPFIFIFNPEILLIDIGGVWHFFVVVGCATLAMMAFVAALQGFFFDRNRWWETALLLLICFTLFRPNFWMDRIVPPYRALPAAEVMRVVEETKGAGALRLRVATQDMSGDDVVKTIRLTLGDRGRCAGAAGVGRHRALAPAMRRPSPPCARARKPRARSCGPATRSRASTCRTSARARSCSPFPPSPCSPVSPGCSGAGAPACLGVRPSYGNQDLAPSMRDLAGSVRDFEAAGRRRIAIDGEPSMRISLAPASDDCSPRVPATPRRRCAGSARGSPPAGAPGVVTEGSSQRVDRRPVGGAQGRQDGRRRRPSSRAPPTSSSTASRPRPWATRPAAAASRSAAAAACSSTASRRPAPAT